MFNCQGDFASKSPLGINNINDSLFFFNFMIIIIIISLLWLLNFVITSRLECSFLCWATLAAVCIDTVPEGAQGSLESFTSCPADGVSCEGRSAVVLRRNDPLPESSALLAILRGARRFVKSSRFLACAAGDLACDGLLSSLAAHVVPAFPASDSYTDWTESGKSRASLRSDWGIPATLKRLVQLLRALNRTDGALGAGDADRVWKLLWLGRGDSFPVPHSLAFLFFLDSDWPYAPVPFLEIQLWLFVSLFIARKILENFTHILVSLIPDII